MSKQLRKKYNKQANYLKTQHLKTVEENEKFLKSASEKFSNPTVLSNISFDNLTPNQKIFLLFAIGTIGFAYGADAANTISSHTSNQNNSHKSNSHKLIVEGNSTGFTTSNVTQVETEIKLINHNNYNHFDTKPSVTSVTSKVIFGQANVKPGVICFNKVDEINPYLIEQDIICLSDQKERNEDLSSHRSNVQKFLMLPELTEIDFIKLSKNIPKLKEIYDAVTSKTPDEPWTTIATVHMEVIKQLKGDNAKHIAKLAEKYISKIVGVSTIIHPSSKEYEQAVKLAKKTGDINHYKEYLKNNFESDRSANFDFNKLREELKRCELIKEKLEQENNCERKYTEAKTDKEICLMFSRSEQEDSQCLNKFDEAVKVKHECQTTCFNFDPTYDCTDNLNQNWYDIGISGASYNPEENAFYN